MVTTDKIYQRFYTRSESIVNYMHFLLDVKPGERLLEPSVGQGHLLKGLESSTDVVAVDIDSSLKYYNEPKYNSFTFINHDFITLPEIFLGNFDKIISNPPFGAYIDADIRRSLRKLYNGISTKESYAIFLYKSINLLKYSGRAVFILPDTFLFLERHKGLRKFIINNYTIENITKFPSKLFPDVNFGYSGMCIISIVKSKGENHKYKIYDVKNHDEFGLIERGQLNYQERESIRVKESHSFRLDSDYLGLEYKNFGEVADIVTGFYSGNDQHFVRCQSRDQKRAGKYQEVSQEQLFLSQPSLLGITKSEKIWIPLVKGGASRYVKPTTWYLDWSEESVKHYITDKKARFQNSQFYFLEGIAVPMVTSGDITGALLENRLFDQSIVGIFPKDKSLLNFFLAFVNTSIFTLLVRNINPSANNSANYIKKVPIIIPQHELLNQINTLVEIILADHENETLVNKIHKEIEKVFQNIYAELL